MRYHLEESGGPEYTIEIWEDGPPAKVVCIIPTWSIGIAEAERIADLMLDAVRTVEGRPNVQTPKR